MLGHFYFLFLLLHKEKASFCLCISAMTSFLGCPTCSYFKSSPFSKLGSNFTSLKLIWISPTLKSTEYLSFSSLSYIIMEIIIHVCLQIINHVSSRNIHMVLLVLCHVHQGFSKNSRMDEIAPECSSLNNTGHVYSSTKTAHCPFFDPRTLIF